MRRIHVQKLSVVGLLLMCSPTASAWSQVDRPSLDSLVAVFIEKGSIAQWKPSALFRECPALDAEQRRVVSLLMSSDLTLRRTDDLGSSWGSALARCGDPALEQWYFDTMTRAIRDGTIGHLFKMRRVLTRTATPAVQSYLRSVMLDATMPENARAWAGGTLIEQLPTRDARAEWQRAVESEPVPWPVVRYVTRRLLNEDPRWLVPELARRIRADPDITQSPRLQTIFMELFAEGTPAQRETVARAIQDAAARTTAQRRESMRVMADWMRRGRQDGT